jgi:hypothetical protein
MGDELLTIRESWPGTTIDGEPRVASGILALSRSPDGALLLNLTVGPAGAPPEECDHVEFPLSAASAGALRAALPGA